jgi:hypothetical protein
MLSPTPVCSDELSPELGNTQTLYDKVVLLRTRDAELTERIERDLREREEVRGALSETEAELEKAVQAPVAGGVDPTAWLPDEIVYMILVQVLAGGTCGRVCRRWHAVCAGATAKKEAWQWRWAGYTHGGLTPRRLISGATLILGWEESAVTALATSWQNTLYAGAEDGTIQVWSTVTNTRRRALRGHADVVNALVVGKDGTVYSASADSTVRIWSGEDGSHIHTLKGGTHSIRCLAVGADGTVYSGSADKTGTIRVWSGRRDGSRLIRTLVGHTDVVSSIALSIDNKLYSASDDRTLCVWSVDDGSHLGTLEGHTDVVAVVAVGADGTIYSGSFDSTVRLWSGLDGSPIRTLRIGGTVLTIDIGAGNTVLFGGEARLCSWGGGAAPVRTLYTFTEITCAVAIGQDGRLFVACYEDPTIYEL